MVPVQDRRFEQGDWPITFEIPQEKADSWLSYLYAECAKRGWSSGGMGQLEARENSGTVTINTGALGQAQIAVIWERRRNGPLKVRAKSAGASDFPSGETKEFFDDRQSEHESQGSRVVLQARETGKIGSLPRAKA